MTSEYKHLVVENRRSDSNSGGSSNNNNSSSCSNFSSGSNSNSNSCCRSSGRSSSSNSSSNTSSSSCSVQFVNAFLIVFHSISMYASGSSIILITLFFTQLCIIERAAMYSNAYGCNHPFSSMVRMKLIYSIMTSDEDNCCRLNIRRLLKDSEGRKDFNNSVVAFYPLHDYSERDR